MENYGELWDDYSGDFNSKLVDLHGDWSKLDKDEQEIAALWKLYVDVYNGGFIQFFSIYSLSPIRTAHSLSSPYTRHAA